MTPKRAKAAAFALIVCLVCALAASAAAGGNGSKRATALSLSIANPSVGSDFLDYVAKSKGFFTKNGVDVTIVDQFPPASTASYVVSGKVDLALFAGPQPLTVAAQGQDTTIVLAFSGGGSGGSVVAQTNGITSLSQLSGKSNCRIGTLAPGSAAYGWAAIYRLEFHIPGCDLVPLSDAASQAGALASGRVDALVGQVGTYASLVSSGQAKLLIDTRVATQRKKYTGPLFAEGVIYGLKSNVQSKRPAVVAWLKGVLAAYDYVQSPSTTNAELVTILKGYDEFKGMSDTDLGSLVVTLKSYMLLGGVRGYVTAPAWKLALSRFANWAIPAFDQNAANNSYASRVDMSYYDAAVGNPTILKVAFSPAAPRAGKLFSVKGSGIAACSAVLAKQSLGKKSCAWRLPASAHRKTLTVYVSGYAGAHRAVTFRVK